jgi:hypothetical protein
MLINFTIGVHDFDALVLFYVLEGHHLINRLRVLLNVTVEVW